MALGSPWQVRSDLGNAKIAWQPRAFRNKVIVGVCKKSMFIIILHTCPEMSVTNVQAICLFCLINRIKIVGKFIKCSLSSVNKLTLFWKQYYRQFTFYCFYIVSLLLEVVFCPAWTHRASYFYLNSCTFRFICSNQVNGPCFCCWYRPWLSYFMLVFLLLTTSVSRQLP